jgi:hypothetical protein
MIMSDLDIRILGLAFFYTDAYFALDREAAKVGLKINEQMIRDVGQSVAIGDKHFEVVKEFVYLGSLMTPTNDLSLEKQRRIQTANRCFRGLRKHLHLFRAKPNGRRNQGRPKSRWADGVNSDNLALGVRDWTHCAHHRQTWRDLFQQALTRYWL